MAKAQPKTAPEKTGAALPDLELLTKDAEGKWQKVGALWKKETVQFSGTVTLGDQTVNVIVVPRRDPKPKTDQPAD